MRSHVAACIALIGSLTSATGPARSQTIEELTAPSSWSVFNLTEGAAFYLNAAHLEAVQGMPTQWMLAAHYDPYAFIRFQFDCSGGRMREIASTFVDLTGEVRHTSIEERDWAVVRDGTFNGDMLSARCTEAIAGTPIPRQIRAVTLVEAAAAGSPVGGP